MDWNENVKGLCVLLARNSLELHDFFDRLPEPAATHRARELQTILAKLQAAIWQVHEPVDEVFTFRIVRSAIGTVLIGAEPRPFMQGEHTLNVALQVILLPKGEETKPQYLVNSLTSIPPMKKGEL